MVIMMMIMMMVTMMVIGMIPVKIEYTSAIHGTHTCRQWIEFYLNLRMHAIVLVDEKVQRPPPGKGKVWRWR